MPLSWERYWPDEWVYAILMEVRDSCAEAPHSTEYVKNVINHSKRPLIPTTKMKVIVHEVGAALKRTLFTGMARKITYEYA